MKYILLLSLIWVGYFVANICIADINANTRKTRMQQGIKTPINHFAWGLWYGILCAPMYLFFKDWFLLSSIILLHGAVLGPSFAILAKFPSAWYLATDSAAITDKIMIWLKMKSTEIFNFSCLFASLILLVISFFQNH